MAYLAHTYDSPEPRGGGGPRRGARVRPWRWPAAAAKAAAALCLVALIGFLLAPGSSNAETTTTGSDSSTSAGTTTTTQPPIVPILFPLEKRITWDDTFGEYRTPTRSHEGNDLLGSKMTPELAVVSGTLDWLNMDSEPYSSTDWRPDYNILLRGDDGNDYFYIHLNNDTPGTDDGKGGTYFAYAAGMDNGVHVQKGQVIGYMGDSGNAEDSVPHLHFEIHLGGYKHPIDPYRSLMAAQTYAEYVAAGGHPVEWPPAPTTTTTKPPTSTTTTTTPPPTTTTTTRPPTTTTTTTPLPAAPFKDVAKTDWFYGDLQETYAAGVVKGSNDGGFHPYDQVTRAQFAAFLVRALDIKTGTSKTQVFTDVPSSFWGFAEVNAAAKAGLIKGDGDGTRFSPNATITRAQMAVMVCRAVRGPTAAGLDPPARRPFTDVPVNYWAAAEVAKVLDLDLMSGAADGHFRPEDTTKRAQAVAVIARAMRLLQRRAGS